MTSARTKTGMEKLWSTVIEFSESVGKTNIVDKRAKQRVATMWNFLQVRKSNLFLNETFNYFGNVIFDENKRHKYFL